MKLGETPLCFSATFCLIRLSLDMNSLRNCQVTRGKNLLIGRFISLFIPSLQDFGPSRANCMDSTQFFSLSPALWDSWDLWWLLCITHPKLTNVSKGNMANFCLVFLTQDFNLSPGCLGSFPMVSNKMFVFYLAYVFLVEHCSGSSYNIIARSGNLSLAIVFSPLSWLLAIWWSLKYYFFC